MEDVFKDLLEDEEFRKELIRFKENIKVFNTILESVKDLVESGALETLVGLGYLGETIKSVASDEMISSFSSLSGSALELLARATSPSLEEILKAVADHPIELEKEIKKTNITGVWSLLNQLRDEEVRRGLSILIAYLKLIGRYAYRNSK